MKVRFKKLSEKACVPSRAHSTDAGYDLVAVSRTFDENGCVVYGTGLAVEIPQGHVGLLFPRSSNAKKDLLLSNSVGVIDSGYRGEVTMKFRSVMHFYNPLRLWWQKFVTGRKRSGTRLRLYASFNRLYDVGERIGQLIIIPIPDIEFEESDALSDSERGEGGYGSTGR